MRRVLGFGCLQMWIFMVFYSIILYINTDAPRDTAYLNQLVSLCAVVLMAGLMCVIYRPNTHIAQSKMFAWGGGVLAALGSGIAIFSNLATAYGMFATALAGIATGVGSGCLFILWMRMVCDGSQHLAAVEFGLATAVAFVGGFLLLAAPPFIALPITVVAPLASAACFSVCFAAPTGRNAHSQFSDFSKSSSTLFARLLVGMFLIGLLQGFTDLISGSAITFSPTEFHSFAIFLAGLLGMLAVIVIGAVCANPLDVLYRVSMLLIGSGLVLLSLTEGSRTFYTAVSFTGYEIFTLFVCLVARLLGKSFRVGTTRTIAIAVAILYAGEALGLIIGNVFANHYGSDLPISTISVLCILLFFVVHLFLITETGLVQAGIGEMGTTVGPPVEPSPEPAADEAAPEAATADSPSMFQVAADSLTERFGLSPREAEVLVLLLQGRTMSRIQEALFISAGTVSTHTRHIYQKIGVANRQELIDLAFSENQ